MAELNTSFDEQPVDTSVFVVIENKSDCYDFVTIDEDTTHDAVVIDLSQDEFTGVISIDYEVDDDSDSFVSIDDDQIFISDFTADDLFFNFDFK